MTLFKFNTKDSSKCLPFHFKASITHTTPQQTHEMPFALLHSVYLNLSRALPGASPNLFFTFEITEDVL